MTARDVVSVLGPGLVGAVLLLAAWLKAGDPLPFVAHVARLGIRPFRWTAKISLAAVSVEAAWGVALIVRWMPSLVLPTTMILLLLLSCVTLWSTSSGRVEDCGCYNGAVDVSPGQSVGLNLLYATLVGAGWWAGGRVGAPAAWKTAAVLASGVAPLPIAWRALRWGKRLFELTPLKVGRRWRAAWLRGHPPDIVRGEHIVVFMSSTCPHCKKWIPVLNAVSANRALPSVVGALALEPEKVVAFVDEHRIRFPVVIASRRTTSRLARVVPTAVLLEDGIVKERWIGRISDLFAARIRSALGMPAPLSGTADAKPTPS